MLVAVNNHKNNRGYTYVALVKVKDSVSESMRPLSFLFKIICMSMCSASALGILSC